jgi:hypothetical protein
MDLEASLKHAHGTTHSVPRWAKGFGISVIILVLLFIGLHVIGMSLLGPLSGGHGDHILPSGATERGMQHP